MTDITRDDIRAAVSAGMVDEAQAASILALADARRGVRERITGLDEPFELFRGFNEIFIVVGLGILYMGYVGVTGLSVALSIDTAGYVLTIVWGLVAVAASCGLSWYFTLKRRMVAPSIALAVLFAISASQVGAGIGWAIDADGPEAFALASGLTTVALIVHYALFRVPFVVAMVAIGVFATCFSLITVQGTLPESIGDVFLLSSDGPFALLTFGLGVLGFAIAMWFDMSDPHRVTRRSRAGFWLHVVSGPAIVNTVALTLYLNGSAGAWVALVAFVTVLALLAVVIDRRSFLISGIGYIVAVVGTVSGGQGAAALVLVLGIGLIVLGAQWERFRGALMRSLPAFPGKTRLPPWTLLETKA